MKSLVRRTAEIAVIAFTLPCVLTFAATFDVSSDYSSINNPNGVWSYGWSSGLGSTFHLHTQNSVPSSNGIDQWDDPGHCVLVPACLPNMAHNGTANEIVSLTAVFRPGQISLHPGLPGDYSIVRWTSPAAYPIRIDAKFIGLDYVGTTTDVHILHNGLSVFDIFIDDVDGFTNLTPDTEVSLHALLGVSAGDTIDFAAGLGSNGNFFFDTTGLEATIAPIPEPPSIVLFSIAMAVVLARLAGPAATRRIRRES